MSDPANNPEHLDGPSAFAEVAEVTSLGDLPMIVDTAAEHPWGLASSENDRLDEEWTAGQDHWVSLSSAAQLLSVDNTGHHIEVDRPDVVNLQIAALLAAAPTAPNPRAAPADLVADPIQNLLDERTSTGPGRRHGGRRLAVGDVILYAPCRHPAGRAIEVNDPPAAEKSQRQAFGRSPGAAPSLESRRRPCGGEKSSGSEESAAIHPTSPSNSALASALSQKRAWNRLCGSRSAPRYSTC